MKRTVKTNNIGRIKLSISVDPAEVFRRGNIRIICIDDDRLINESGQTNITVNRINRPFYGKGERENLQKGHFSRNSIRH